MLLLSSRDTAQKFSPPIASGLRSLLAPPPLGGGPGGAVVTRAIAAGSSRGCGGAGGVQETRDGACITGGVGDAGSAEAEEGEDAGCWVSYGRREPRRRLPPPIPSLLARGALRRTRTHDGRLVIRIVPFVWAECIRARRRGGRLTMQLVVEHDDESPLLALPAAQTTDEDVVRALDTAAPGNNNSGEGVGNDTAAAAPDVGSEGIDDAEEADVAPQDVRMVVPPPRVPSAGCFEDVFKYSSIGGSSSLHRVPSLRMVH